MFGLTPGQCADPHHARGTHTPGSHQIDDELHEEHRLAALEVSGLAGLTLDDEIRRLATDAHDVVIRVPIGQKRLAKEEAEFEHAFTKLEVALCACAARIRDLYRSGALREALARTCSHGGLAADRAWVRYATSTTAGEYGIPNQFSWCRDSSQAFRIPRREVILVEVRPLAGES